ncbi:cysteine-rich RLK (RECEPTOR-like protein kinase) 8 [Striga hermonthica]|uniref:Cysteine-rich RLK (RECEPTOR-like protein kinase) 8 n=1 Tax=Striga hermonthica TaxID=68872 RepID=A0A9N7MXZ5_STRHE|nr:cysteine-rich RLK (RECEPTOR-like protein kinase) 8 [Striga hermonthica]
MRMQPCSSLRLENLCQNLHYEQAAQDGKWITSMNKELEALEVNNTWELTQLPAGKKAIGCRWIYKIKRNPDGSVDKFKARLVAKGYLQKEGIDFFDSFSPVAKLVSVRLLIALATQRKWELHHIDINNAFLHGFLEEEVYMVPPKGYTKAAKGEVCLLKRSLYGLKQASRQWNIEFSDKLLGYGFIQSKHDHCMFIKHTGSTTLALLIYVDDVLTAGNSLAAIQSLKEYLHNLFTIKDLGPAKYFLGLEIYNTGQGTYLTQRKYILDLLHDLGLSDCKPSATPFPSGINLSSQESPTLPDSSVYRRLIGRLLYLNLSRANISYGIQQLSQFVQTPTQAHWAAAIHLLNEQLNHCAARWSRRAELRIRFCGLSICKKLQSTKVLYKMEDGSSIAMAKRMKVAVEDGETLVEGESTALVSVEENGPRASEQVKTEIAHILEKINSFTEMVSELLDSGKSMLKELSNDFEERMISIHKEQILKWHEEINELRLLDAANEDADALLQNAKYLLQIAHAG